MEREKTLLSAFILHMEKLKTLGKEKNIDKSIESSSKLELYRLIDEGYRTMQEGRESTIEEVEERIKSRRAERG